MYECTESPTLLVFWYDRGWIVTFLKVYVTNTESSTPLIFWYDRGWIVMLPKVYVTNMVTSQLKCCVRGCVAELWRAMWKAQMREKRGSEAEENTID